MLKYVIYTPILGFLLLLILITEPRIVLFEGLQDSHIYLWGAYQAICIAIPAILTLY